MKLLGIAMLSMVMVEAAAAQTYTTRENASRAALVARGEAPYLSTLGSARLTDPDGEPRECLRNKASKKVVCHTRAEWTAIARQTDAGQPSGK